MDPDSTTDNFLENPYIVISEATMDGVQQLDKSDENPTSSENFGVSIDEQEKLNGTVENPSTSELNEAREDFDQSLQCEEDVPSWFDSMLHTLANSEKEEQVVDTQLKVIKSQKSNNQTHAVSETPNLEDAEKAARISTVPSEADDDDTRIIEIDTKNITVPSWFSKLDEPESVKQTTQVVEIQSMEPTSTSTPEDIATWLETQPKLSASSKSGYIVFSHEVRKRVINENSAATFTEIAKIIGQEWTNLPSSTKKLYDSRAKFIVSEREKLGLTSSYSRILKPGQIRIYMCKWRMCDYQFDSTDGLMEHLKRQHIQNSEYSYGEYECVWTACLKYRRDAKPWPTSNRLVRHLREKHIPKAGSDFYPTQKGKNYFVFHEANDGGKFEHQPYGIAEINPLYTDLATPYPKSQAVVVNKTITSIPIVSSLSTSTTTCQPTLVYTLQNGPSTSQQPSGTFITYEQNMGLINGAYIVQNGLTTPYDPMLGQYVPNPPNSESFTLETGEILPPTSSNSLTEYLLQNSTTEYLLKLSETNEASNSSYPSDMEIQEHGIDANAVPNNYSVIDEGQNFQYEIAFLKQENERLDAERETAYAHAKEMAQQLEKALEEVRKLKKENNNLKEAVMKNYRVIKNEQIAKNVILEENKRLKVALTKTYFPSAEVTIPIESSTNPSIKLPSFAKKTKSSLNVGFKHYKVVDMPSTSSTTSEPNTRQGTGKVIKRSLNREEKTQELGVKVSDKPQKSQMNDETEENTEKKPRLTRSSLGKISYDDVLRDLYEVPPVELIIIDLPPVPDIKKLRHYPPGSAIPVSPKR